MNITLNATSLESECSECKYVKIFVISLMIILGSLGNLLVFFALVSLIKKFIN